MSNITTTDVLTPAIKQQMADRLLVSRTRALIHSLAVKEVNLKIRNGNTMRFTRPDELALVRTKLSDSGDLPPAQLLTATRIDAEVAWYGTFIATTEQVVITNQDPTLNMGAEQLGKCMKESDDAFIRDVLASTASFYDCVYGLNGDTPTNLTSADLSQVYTNLRGNDAFEVIAGKEGVDKFGSSPVTEAYVALGHTDLIPSLRSMNTFTEKIRYPSQVGVLNAEFGAAEGFRVFLSTLGSKSSTVSAAGKTIYNLLTMGREAAAVVRLAGNGEFIYKKPIDPLNRVSTMAVKWVQVPKILNDMYIVRTCATL